MLYFIDMDELQVIEGCVKGNGVELYFGGNCFWGD